MHPDRHMIKIALSTLKLSESGAVCMGTSHKAAIRTLIQSRMPVRTIRQKLKAAGWSADDTEEMIRKAYNSIEW